MREFLISPADQEVIDNDFTHHPPTPEQAKKYPRIRRAAKLLCELIYRLVPGGPERTLAKRALERAVFWANAGVARYSDYDGDVVVPDIKVDDLSHPSIEEVTREVIYRDDAIQVAVLDEPSPTNACHIFETCINRGHYRALTRTYYQKGPIGEVGVNGTTNEAELAKVIHRLKGFQAGEFACDENEQALYHISQGLEILESRTADRKARGVEGKDEK